MPQCTITQIKREELNARLPVIFAHWRLMGVREVTIAYDGQGDSGSFEPPQYDGTDASDKDDIKAFPEDYATEHLNALGLDWWNNEGGYGQYTFHVATQSITYETHQRIEETIDSGGEIDVTGNTIVTDGSADRDDGVPA